jgi:hypothetical protein
MSRILPCSLLDENHHHVDGVKLIPQLIYEHGEPWWDDDFIRGNLLAHPPYLSGHPTSRDIK